MYDKEIYSVRYPVDVSYNGVTNYNNYSMPPEAQYPYPPMSYPEYPSMPCPEYPSMPCPEYPSMPPVLPPVQPIPPIEPIPPILPPAPPIGPMPGTRMQCLIQLKRMLEKIKDKKVALIIEGARGNFDCSKIVKVDDCTVVVETKNGVCVVPLNQITAICMTKEVAEDVLKDRK